VLINLLESIIDSFLLSSHHHRIVKRKGETLKDAFFFFPYMRMCIYNFDKFLDNNVLRLNAQYKTVSFLIIIIVEQSNYLYFY
jgi:hypothetical protein